MVRGVCEAGRREGSDERLACHAMFCVFAINDEM
jgi:hypothetical protein